jgi:hypothetical protein
VYRHLLIIGACAVIGLWTGCSNDSGGSGPNCVTSVSLDSHEMELEVGTSAVLTPTVRGGEDKSLSWYVNGIEDGNDIVGTITYNSPVTFKAPDSLPDPATVEIRAISVEDTMKYDSCMVTVTFKVIHVDIESGDDTAGNGYAHNPVKTISRGNQLAASGGTVLVAPGVYNADHGEAFPIYPGNGVTIEGQDWETCIIRGSGAYGYAMDPGQGSTIRKFTFESDVELGAGRWEHYIYMRNENIRVDSIRTSHRTDYAPIRIRRATGAIVENSVFEVSYLPPPPSGIGMNRAFEILDDNTGTIIRNCRISGFYEGLRITQDATTLVENCVIEGNDYGVYICCAAQDPNPDFGGGARGSAGNNTIVNNVTCGLYNDSNNVIFAKYNTWNNNPPVAGTDYCVDGSGGVIYE